MNNDINNFIDNMAEMSGGHLILKPVSRPAVRYVGVAGSVAPSASDKPEPASAKAPLKRPADSAAPGKPVLRPGSDPDAPSEAAEENITLRFDMTGQELLTGFILSEVLGRPKCFGMRRRPARE